MITDNELRSALETLNFAREEFERGDPAYLNWALGNKFLEAFVDTCWQTYNAPALLARRLMSSHPACKRNRPPEFQ